MKKRLAQATLLSILTIFKLTSSTKWLIDNPGFDDPSAWIDEHLPCSHEIVIFPEKYQGLLPLPSKVDVRGFTLPQDGAILLQPDSSIRLDGVLTKRECASGKAYIREPTIHKWFSPTTWRSTKQVSSNKAIPDMERVPCNNESVVIQSNGPLAFDLENVPYLRVGQISFSGSLLSKNYFKQLLYTDVGQFLFKNQAGVNIEYYHHDVCGCHKDFNNFAEPICHNTVCERPQCLVPVVPYGSCCATCGVVLKFQVNFCESEKLHILRNVIENSLKEQDSKDDLDYFVNYVSSANYGNYLQAVIVDRNTYSEKSLTFLRKLNESMDWRRELKMDSGHVFAIEYSGRPYNPNVTFGSVILILLCFAFVSIVALVIFAHYSPENRYLHYVPRWTYDPRLWRSFIPRPNTVFARFDNARASVMTTNAEVGRTTRFNMGYDAESGNVRERAFDNPMFGEVPASSKTVASEKPAAKSAPSKDVPELVMESLDMVVGATEDNEEQQELTEIRLEACSSSSDDEDDNGFKVQETKE